MSLNPTGTVKQEHTRKKYFTLSFTHLHTTELLSGSALDDGWISKKKVLRLLRLFATVVAISSEFLRTLN